MNATRLTADGQAPVDDVMAGSSGQVNGLYESPLMTYGALVRSVGRSVHACCLARLRPHLLAFSFSLYFALYIFLSRSLSLCRERIWANTVTWTGWIHATAAGTRLARRCFRKFQKVNSRQISRSSENTLIDSMIETIPEAI